MSFKIKHENSTNLIICLIFLVLTFLFLFLDLEISVWGCIACAAVSCVSAVFYFLEQLAGTKIVIEDKTVIIKYFLRRRKIVVEQICNMSVKKYTRHRRRPSVHTEYRMRMTIDLLDGKKIILTDKATAVNGVKGILLCEYDEVPDEEVSLYKAYHAIRQRCVKYNGWQIAEAADSDSYIR